MTQSGDPSQFARTWRDAQQHLWEEPARDEERAAHYLLVEQAWQNACTQWWSNLRHVVPASLRQQLESALRQTQLCLRLAVRGNQISAHDLDLIVNPTRDLRAAMELQAQNKAETVSAAERAELLASQALLTRIGNITQSVLHTAHVQIHDDEQGSPRELYQRYAAFMEGHYRVQAADDEFARLVARWLTAHVEVVAERRRAGESMPKSATRQTDEHHLDSCPDGPLAADTTVGSAAASTAGLELDAESTDHRIAQQMRVFSDKLAAGATSLGTLAAGDSSGISVHEVVYQCEGVKLLRYRGASRATGMQHALPPLLLVYSLVNRPYILDLNEDRSFIRALCDAGRDVYLIDWGYPSMRDKDLGLDDYINRYLHACVTYLQPFSDTDKVDLIGICQGGPFALSYTALEPARIRRLALLVAPFDFHTDDFLLSRWLREVDVPAVVDKLGNVPGYLLNWGFVALKPVTLSAIKSLDLLDLLDRPIELATFAQMEHWLQDNPDQAGKAFAEFSQTFIQDNGLINASARIGARVVDLSAVRHKVLNIFAARDHIVPPSASRPLAKFLHNAQCTNRQVDCGHIGALAARRARSQVPQILTQWFAQPD